MNNFTSSSKNNAIFLNSKYKKKYKESIYLRLSGGTYTLTCLMTSQVSQKGD